MKHRFLIAFLVLTTFNHLKAQKWHQYSDSILVYFQKSDVRNTAKYLKLAEDDLSASKIVEDTIYADFLYRKGVANSLINQKYNIDDLLQSQKIWVNTKHKNHFKIFKLNHFIGFYFYQKSLNSKDFNDYKFSKDYFSKNLEYGNKYNFKNHIFYSSDLYLSATLEYFVFHNKKNIQNYSNEYFKLNSFNDALDKLDMNYYYLNFYLNKPDLQIEILKKYINKLELSEKKDPKKLFDLYIKLIHLKGSKELFNQNSLEIIDIGEKAFKIWEMYQLPKGSEISLVLSDLVYAYSLINDDLNYGKFRLIRAKVFPENEEEIDILVTLNDLLQTKSTSEVKYSFNQLLEKSITHKQFENILKLYSFSITQFQKGYLFNNDEIKDHINHLISLKKSIPNDLIIDYDGILCMNYLIINDFNSLKSISSKYINSHNIDLRLKFLNLYSLAEKFLGNISEAKIYIERAIKIVEENYGKDDPKLIDLLNTYLEIDMFGSDPNSIKNINRLLAIIYKHNLMNTHSVISTWMALGNKSLTSYNYEDAKIYFERANNSLEKYKSIAGYEYLHYSIIMGILRVNLGKSEFEKAKVNLDYLKDYMFNSKIFFGETMIGEYYSMLASYYFYVDDYENANKTIDLAFEKYGKKLSRIFMIPKILSTYLIDNDYKKAINSLENFQDQYSISNSVANIIYLLKYNNGTLEESKLELIKQLNKLINDNNISFHLLSDFQKEVVYNKFSKQFEFLNGFLLVDKSKDFLSKFIEFRFYSKALLLSNSFYKNLSKVDNSEKLNQWRKNKLEIDILLENKTSSLDSLSFLQTQNREIEQLLLSNLDVNRTPKIEDLQNRLSKNEAYVEIIRINKQSRKATKKGADIINTFSDTLSYGAIIIKKYTEPSFVIIDHENKLEKLYLPDFKRNIQEKIKDTISYERLFEKIDTELNGIEKLYIVSDGVYNTINLETIFNPKTNKYLIDYLDINPIASVRSIFDKEEYVLNNQSKSPIVFIGSPTFRLKNLKTLNMTQNESYFNLERSSESIFPNMKLNYLKGAEKELKEISMKFRKNNFDVEVFDGEAASEINLNNVKSPLVLHIATHGYFISKSDKNSPSNNNVSSLITNESQSSRNLYSGLFLSGAQNSINGEYLDPINNGIFTSEEVKTLNLKNTKLVVLSACDTGLGNNIIGEGVSGLQRSFMLAGAKNIIMSYWKVNDNSTQMLMSNFYENWLNYKMSLSEALKQAKLKLRLSFPNPIDWGSFIILN